MDQRLRMATCRLFVPAGHSLRLMQNAILRYFPLWASAFGIRICHVFPEADERGQCRTPSTLNPQREQKRAVPKDGP
jgi:hypothetical protein